MPTFDMKGPLERHALQAQPDGTVVVSSIVEDDGEETYLVERLIGVVQGSCLEAPEGVITRLAEPSPDPALSSERRLKPAGGAEKVEASQVLSRRAERLGLEEDLYQTRDVDSF